jgi:GxxExxY protein
MELKYLTKEEQDKISDRIIGYAMEVNITTGNRFKEVIYQRCLSIELNEKSIYHQREMGMSIFYKGQDGGLRRADFLVMGEIWWS